MMLLPGMSRVLSLASQLVYDGGAALRRWVRRRLYESVFFSFLSPWFKGKRIIRERVAGMDVLDETHNHPGTTSLGSSEW